MRPSIFYTTCFVISLVVSSTLHAATNADFILLADQNPQGITTGRHWADLLTGLGAQGVQVRAPQPGDKIAIETQGTKASPSFRIVGQIDGGQLVVVGAKFSLSDRAKLAKWLGDLGENGVAGVTEQKAAFGLLPEQLAGLRDDLAQPVSFETKGVPASQAVARIAAALKYKLVIDAEADKALAADDPVRDELKDIASGTALAAIARPAGAILKPEKPAGGEPRYTLVKSTAGAEAWPIGWPLEKGEGQVLPSLLDSLNVEIRDVSVATTLTALGPRLKAPMLLDHNAIVKNRIDMDKKNVSLPAKKMLYATALNQVLFQGGLKYSLRLDDAGKPIFWITSRK